MSPAEWTLLLTGAVVAACTSAAGVSAAVQGMTLVVYIGVAQLDAIVAGLAGALPADTPAALVQAATTAQERRLISTLVNIAGDSRAHSMGSPAVLIVGDVLRGAAAWADAKPQIELQRAAAG